MFTNSIEALDVYKKTLLVITDMTMPQMTGIELVKKIRALRSDIPIIFCTGNIEIINEKASKSIGVQAYIRKPVDKYILAKTIRTALGG